MPILFTNGSTSGFGDLVIFGNLRMWAERGMIHVEDGKDNSYKSLSVRQMLLRMKAIQDMLKNSRQSSRQKHSKDTFDNKYYEENQQMLLAMSDVVRKAQIQGQPEDASARRDLVRRRRKVVVVPGYGGGM